MALSEGLLGTLTMKMLDTFVSIFLAVLWFSAFNQFIRTFKVGTWFPFAAEVVCFVQVMVLYYVAMTVAWLWRDRQVHLTTFTVCGAHYIAFAGIGATTSVQESLSAAVGDEWSVWSSVTSFAFVVMAIGFLMVVYALTWTFFRVDKTDDHSFQRSIDEMEIDITGLVSSFLATQAVRQAITGKFPQKHFFLQSAAWRSYPSSALQRNLMLAWSVMLTFVAAMVLPMFEEWSIKKGDRWTHLGFRFLKVFMVMMVAWGYLVWGSWQFYSQFNGDRMYGNMLFASLCTFVVLTVLYLLSMLQESDKVTSETARETNNITVSGLSLVAAWSWEHCFSLAFDVIGYRYDVGFEGLVPKLFMATAIPVILIPTYVKHVRAAVLAAEEAEEEEEEERKVRILERAGMTPQATGGTSPSRQHGQSPQSEPFAAATASSPLH
ncbi:unnamed protein product [Prorocentrum cordatum]|uniref:Uncharacterized protein n=1 Tax=Prorocentrum cordatum TaxID=2364126 RepID=A0ABN9XFT9_9DINO|nr:unnamed protein product [Polarella glacialis]